MSQFRAIYWNYINLWFGSKSRLWTVNVNPTPPPSPPLPGWPKEFWNICTCYDAMNIPCQNPLPKYIYFYHLQCKNDVRKKCCCSKSHGPLTCPSPDGDLPWARIHFNRCIDSIFTKCASQEEHFVGFQIEENIPVLNYCIILAYQIHNDNHFNFTLSTPTCLHRDVCRCALQICIVHTLN